MSFLNNCFHWFKKESSRPSTSILVPSIQSNNQSTNNNLRLSTHNTNTMDKYIVVEPNENLEHQLLRIVKKTKLTLKPSPRMVKLKVEFETNYPPQSDTTFNRSKYYPLPINADHQDLLSSSFNWQASLEFSIAGTFHIRALVSDSQIWSAYIVVDPTIKVPLNAIKCQTVLTKNLGLFKDWKDRLSVAKDCHYNMIHFTPIQQLGSSNSAYSICDHLKINPSFKANFNNIKQHVQMMQDKWRVLSIVDVVLNHVSNDCQWLREHPEGSYNLDNCKHLKPAFLLDLALRRLSADFAVKKYEIFSETDINSLVSVLKKDYIEPLKIYELFSVDVSREVKKLTQLSRDGSELKFSRTLYDRFTTQLVSIPNFVRTEQELACLLERENDKIKNEIEKHLEAAIGNVASTIRYERLDPNGPHYKQPVAVNRPIVTPYFTCAQPDDKFNPHDDTDKLLASPTEYMANNGWVMGADPLDDFASESSLVYLRRELICWGDCIKLNYGRSPTDSSFLWSRMKSYIEAMADIFHGFRIDNCHSTPIHVAEFMLDAARLKNRDLYVMAELFTNAEATDNLFVNKLGITSLVRESMSALSPRELGRLMHRFGGLPVGAFEQHGSELLRPTTAYAMFYDQTHDNESAIRARSPYDVSSTSSILNMALCASGSTRGYDELVPHHINVVTESRLYDKCPKLDTALMPLRTVLNQFLQQELAQFSEIFVDQVTDKVIAITRHNPVDGRSVVLIAHTAFNKFDVVKPDGWYIKVPGDAKRLLFEACASGDPSVYVRSEDYINGLSQFNIEVSNVNKSTDQSLFLTFNSDDSQTVIQPRDGLFKPSSVAAVEIYPSPEQSKALQSLNNWTLDLRNNFDLSLVDANYILFRCPEEEGAGSYELLGFCKFTYCGLYGLMYYLEKVRENQDQAHPLAGNLRDGPWLSDYIIKRLNARESTKKLGQTLAEPLKNVSKLPRGMRPKYFDIVVTKLYNELTQLVFSKMSPFVFKGPSFVKMLALSSIALVGDSIAAGLPHFSVGFMRDWGRDTFISLRGLMLITGRFNEAKEIILQYAKTCKNGLIPNLYDSGIKPRYNCRDAVWWWLYSIKEYVKMAPSGSEILRCKVHRSCMQGKEQTLYEIIQEVMTIHLQGFEFVEDNAGPNLDEHMTMKGFNIKFGVELKTGFVYGGNEWNCGTWMDKMGSSDKAGTNGKPASPRDGSAIEIVALCKSILSWLDTLKMSDGVEFVFDNAITMKWTWKKWAALIQSNFEQHFYIANKANDPNPELVNKTEIYKDTVGASRKWQDYQLRPNFLVAMVVAPELFDRGHARAAILQAKRNLCGPLGMKTLDPSDWNYCGDYDNSNCSADPKIALGYNYHQGPEWLWLTGYYIRASTKFFGSEEQHHHFDILANVYSTLINSPWLGLPELTNSNGAHCKDSCPTQAWSLATILEALYESALPSE